MTALVAGVELGGTKCVCVLAGGPDDIRDERRIDTRSPAETLPEIAAILAEWRDAQAIGLASFGPVDLDERSDHYGRIVNTPKPGWNGADIVGLARARGLPFGFDTDVAGAALAEGRWGAARGLDSFAYVTVGTGVGVGTVMRGQTVRGLGHSEAGHLRVPRLAGDAFAGACPYHGDCVEGLASGPAIAARAGRSGESLAPGDPAWEPAVAALAAMLHNLVLTSAPERILIGGGVLGGQPTLLPRLRTALVDSLAGYGAAPAIAAGIDDFLQAPALGHQAGPMGAIALGLDAL
ncbi:ROK family protein [Sphingomonas montanisoli]|uniref:fructokinase n=1 Tax=Sphingomonas montanisoli TaxID=2606412 RepID=A0A5D9C870_9SPHN|nr:ROK family protein [Sphingomonas montanisoli]TZG27457.1 ROK family protein [Sphingomonas montanisoli]